jgi:hypothetical protein
MFFGMGEIGHWVYELSGGFGFLSVVMEYVDSRADVIPWVLLSPYLACGISL